MSSAQVVGAGVFGASIARELAKRGWAVTIVEQYAPGTVRSASGGDTRLLRTAHGANRWYADLAWQARTQWLELEEATSVRVFEPIGVAWFAHRDDGFEAQSRSTLDALGVPYEWLTPDDAARLYPTFAGDDLAAVLFETEAGVLHARRATQLLVAEAERLGARSIPGHVTPADDPPGDVVVWACGPWLRGLFPGIVDVKVSRRDVFFFGGDPGWRDTPGFCDYDGTFYGHGDVGGLGVKVAPDFPGDDVDPDTLDRRPLPAWEDAARAYAARRFPSLAGAPLVGSRVCQYDLSGDTHFFVDRHPERASWWIVGGGSGHGFKHGPAFAQYVVDCVEGVREPERFHALGMRTGDAGLRTGSYG